MGGLHSEVKDRLLAKLKDANVRKDALKNLIIQVGSF